MSGVDITKSFFPGIASCWSFSPGTAPGENLYSRVVSSKSFSPRIASYYPDVKMVGRNDGGPLYHTYCLRQIFGDANVEHIFPHKDTIHTHGSFDLHYWVDWGEDALGMALDVECPRPNVYVTSDTHLGYEYRLKRAREFDWVFCNQHKAQQDFIRDGIPADRCFWLPHAFDPMAYSPGVFNVKTNAWMPNVATDKKYDVCFVGNLNDLNRVTHLDRLFKEFKNFRWSTARFHEAAEIFNHSKIVFNISCRHELNMRFFEALGSGSLLLSDNLPEGENVFIPGFHYVGYDGMDNMIEKAHTYLSPNYAEAIKENGYKEAIRNHTYLHRVKTVLDTIGFDYDKEKVGHWLSEMSLGKDVRREELEPSVS